MVMPQSEYEEQRDSTGAHKTSPAPTASSLKGMKDPLNRRFLHVSPRSVSPAAVDKAVSARDSYEEYRPHESPANKHIIHRAVDAVGIPIAPE